MYDVSLVQSDNAQNATCDVIQKKGKEKQRGRVENICRKRWGKGISPSSSQKKLEKIKDRWSCDLVTGLPDILYLWWWDAAWPPCSPGWLLDTHTMSFCLCRKWNGKTVASFIVKILFLFYRILNLVNAFPV